jgi:hypothetical protein
MKLPLLLAASLSLAALRCAAEPVPASWQSPNGDFSVVFSGKPEVTHAEPDSTKGTSRLDMAGYRRPDGFEHAEASANPRTKPITKAEALQIGEGWSKFLNLANPKMSFDEFTPDDKKLIVKGIQKFNGADMSIMAVFHWGKKTNFLVWVAESPYVFPTPAATRFFASVHQNWK